MNTTPGSKERKEGMVSLVSEIYISIVLRNGKDF